MANLFLFVFLLFAFFYDNVIAIRCIQSYTHVITSSALNECLLVQNFQNSRSTECHR